MNARNNHPIVLIVIAALFILACTSAGCSTPASRTVEGPIPVAVSIPPLKEIAEAIGSDRISVEVVLPPGTEPHTFEPTPGQIQRLSQSAIFFTIGEGLLPFEDRLADRLSSQNQAIRIVSLSEEIDLIRTDHDGQTNPTGDPNHHDSAADPHIWLSPHNGAIMAEKIATALIAADPGGEENYRENLLEYRLRTQRVDEEVRGILSGIQNRRFIVTHDAWGYFAREYGLEQIAVHVGGKEPTAREIQEIISTAHREELGVVFIEPQFPQRSALVIADEIGGRVVVIDPLAEAYLENFIEVAEALKGGKK
ncbi:metal ABC transporter solute-binding protein, Zn/Mn family [Methanocalculus taiwanensis]|uniref:metal ABC transporter solute-binding protein, Zn/Mn family n=1 Tax=Methanocalculus taiwanensis TaxID=106207 RepID=UPI002100B85C|nr:zinc ABC transporter substrate-binding protein [Methanocalculus taiwanensis]